MYSGLLVCLVGAVVNATPAETSAITWEVRQTEVAVVHPEGARITLIRPLERKVIRIELPVDWTPKLALGRKYYVNYVFPSGYSYSDFYSGNELLSRRQLVLRVSEYRMQRAGFREGDELRVALSVDQPLGQAPTGRISNPLVLRWQARRETIAGRVERSLIATETPAPSGRVASERAGFFTSMLQEPNGGDPAVGIQATIDADPLLSAHGVKATVSGGVATLTGTVPTDAALERAKQVVRDAGFEVNSELTVVPVEPIVKPDPVVDPAPLPYQKGEVVAEPGAPYEVIEYCYPAPPVCHPPVRFRRCR